MNDKGKGVNSDWLAGQWDKQRVLRHVQINKGMMRGDDPEIDTAQIQKRSERRLALQEKIRKTFAASTPERLWVRIHT